MHDRIVWRDTFVEFLHRMAEFKQTLPREEDIMWLEQAVDEAFAAATVYGMATYGGHPSYTDFMNEWDRIQVIES